MLIHLPIANIDVNFLNLIFLGVFAGIASGLFGLGGGIITTPIMILSGLPSSVIISTSAMQLLGTSASGTLVNVFGNKVDFTIGFIMLIGGFIGSFGGSNLLKILIQIGYSDIVISVSYVLVMTIIASMLYYETISDFFAYYKKDKERLTDFSENKEEDAIEEKGIFCFYSTSLNEYVNVVYLILIGISVGLIGSICGIGGSMIVVPLLTKLYNMPFQKAAATALFQVLFISFYLSIFYALNGMVDIILGSIILLASTLFVRVGVFLQSKMSLVLIRFLLTILVTTILIVFLLRLFAMPLSVFSVQT